MKWNELVVTTTQEAKEAVANILNEFGANGVVVEEAIKPASHYGFRFGEIYDLDGEKFKREGARIKAYYLDDAQWPSLKQKIVDKIEGLRAFKIVLDPLNISVNELEASDWENEWKQYFKPFFVTNQFKIVPTWEETEQELDDYQTILMDPGMAFGTGTHPTTKLSLQALEKVVKKDDLIIDVGSGSGILSIAASLLGASRVFSYDLDEVAVNSTINNRDLNDLSDTIIVKQNDLLKGIRQEEKVDVIVANILAHIILELIDDAYENVKTEGYFIVSGIIEKEVANIKKALEEKGFKLYEHLEEEHWHTFITKKIT